ncbi:hypothetical protein BDY21DRAFT_349917 [Lineolata rhizophorae]|uniref:HDA1 complex subunit n=1 Tax=Lineolata rhizophorae TaxID=578093 RepID=A0A6A6NVW6_9PEZI|nr:hypothetical protein BDY21DRAFT_349917 [Lineolata rhizophorae]
MWSGAREHYRDVMRFNRELLEHATQDEWLQHPSAHDEAEALLNRLFDVATHIDLDNPEITDPRNMPVDPIKQSKWNYDQCSKFTFLTHFICDLGETDAHIILVSMPGQAMDILETHIKAYGVRFRRTDRQPEAEEFPEGRLNLRFTLVPSSGEGSAAELAKCDAVIAMDRSYARKPNINLARDNEDYFAPLIYLVIYNSIEHVNMCLHPPQGPDRTRVLSHCSVLLREEVGYLPCDFPDEIDLITSDIASFILARSTLPEDWPMPSLGPLRMLEQFMPSLSQSSFPGTLSSQPPPLSAVVAGQKHSRDSSEIEPVKKPRTAAPPDPTAADADQSVTHITDSIAGGSQPYDYAKLYRYAKSRLDERTQALEDLQTRFERQSARLADEIKAHKDTQDTNAALTKRVDNLTATVANLKAERTDLENRLREAMAAMADSSVPEIAQMQRLTNQLTEAQEAQRNAEKKLRSQEEDFNFLRSEYQNASHAASERAGEIKELEEKLATLEKQASGEMARARGTTVGVNRQQDLQEIQRLLQTIKFREELLVRKEEEIRALKGRQALGTRSVSVPRSPRVPANGGSRSGSPMPGSLGGRLSALRGSRGE